MWLPGKIRRLWRGRGHGVHSPFAYRFITNVLRLKGAYYATDELSRLPDPKWHTLIFRLVCEFEPDTIMTDHISGPLRRSVALADSRVGMVEDDTPDVVMRSKDCVVTAMRDIRADAERWQSLRSSMATGMTFTDRRMGVAVERPDLPRQDFEIDFRL